MISCPEREKGLWQWGLPLLSALALTPLALIAHGYKFVNDDQILYIPMLYHRLDASLYPGDYFFVNQPQASISWFEDVLAVPLRWLGLEWTMAAGYLLAQLAILFCAYLLAESLTRRKPAAYLAMVLFVLPVSIGGSYVRTYDNYFDPRTLTLPLGLLALVALSRRRLGWAALLVGLHLLLHPLSGLHTWLVTLVLLAWWSWRERLPARRWPGPLVVLIAVLGWLAWNAAGGSGLWLDPDWRAVLWRRTSYIFLASWRWTDWLPLAVYAVLAGLGWSCRRRSHAVTQLAVAGLGVAGGALVGVAVGVDWLGMAPVAQLQLARAGWLVILLGVIFGADLVVFLCEQSGWGGWLVAVLLATAIYHNRADLAWQPVFAFLTGWLLAARGLRTLLGGRAVNAWLALGGSGVLLPGLLAAWPATHRWAERTFGGWLVPAEALWPALLAFGLVWFAKQARRPERHRWWNRAGLAAASGLAAAALALLAIPWLMQDWPAYLAARLQLPAGTGWMSPDFAAWRDVQLWAAAHTPATARFATDPDDKGFRVFSQRSPIVEQKDGASAMFNRAYAMEWQARMLALQAAGVVDADGQPEQVSFSEAGLVALHGLYPFDYVVGRRPQSLAWPVAYCNSVFAVYAWPKGFSE